MILPTPEILPKPRYSYPSVEFYYQIGEAADEGNNILLSEESDFELELIRNNDTRWNSTYLMTERALRKQYHIEAFLAKNESESNAHKQIPAEDAFTFEDWRLLVELKEILQPLYHQTLRTQGWCKEGSYGALWEVLVGVEFLLMKMEDWKAFFEQNDEEQPRRRRGGGIGGSEMT